jgi:hypothetical protein
MARMTVHPTREIIEDFAAEIQRRQLHTPKPKMAVINFRTDMRDGVEREVVKVPIGLLRYRKDNGRITSDVMDHERNVGPLDERDDQAQATIRHFLEIKDPEKTATLRKTILHDGQRDPAIVTCDGFIINGNRRKMVMERLHVDFPDDPNFGYMKVVILPGRDGEGGAPTLLEIEQIENRYQLQSDGRSEYYGFDRALSIERKIELGLTLEEQLRDDPRYAGMSATELGKVVQEYERKYLRPLMCVKRYLRQFHREGLYRTVSTGVSDPEGRWQAFVDYSETYDRCLANPKRRIESGIEEDEIGTIEEAAFDIIRLRVVPDMPKVHKIMRDLPKYCGTKEGKKEVAKITEEVEPVLASKECFDQKNTPLTADEIDAKWAAKNRESIIHHLKKASRSHEIRKEKETPLELLEAAYKKLTHEDMDLRSINQADYKRARDWVVQIKSRAEEIEGEIYHMQKEFKKLGRDDQ